MCKIADILYKFDDEAKKDLGVDITIDACRYHLPLETNEEVIDTDRA